MIFVLRMALRETRAGWKRLLFYFVCVAIGVGSIVLLRSAIRNFYDVMAADARTLMTADLQIDSSRPFSDEALRVIDRLAVPPTVTGKTQTIEANTMLRPADSAKEGALMVDLKGVEASFPFYGKVVLADGMQFSADLLRNNGVLVARPVLDRLDLKVNDQVKIGTLICRIRGIIEREPGGGMGFRYGPRVLIDRSSLESAGLTGFGSRARRRILLRAPDADIDRMAEQFRKQINNNMIRVRTYKNSQENINEQYARAENFLSLTGLIILVLGGIGISSVTRVFIEQKRKSIAVLKCLGATGRRVMAAYMTQIVFLGIAGSVVGIALAKLGMALIHAEYAEKLPPDISYSLQSGAIFQGLGVGILITILFSAIPLMRVRRIKPNVLLREEEEKNARFDWPRWIMAVVVGLGLVLLASWQAGSLKAGAFFLGGLVIATAALSITATLLTRALRRMKRRLRLFPVRHAINSLHRPGNQTLVIVLGVGLGVFFIIATQSLRQNLLRELDFDRRGKMPNFYLIDIQSDQQKQVAEMIQRLTHEKAELIPTVRARIAAIDGRQVNFEDPATRKDRGRLGFEYTLTYRGHLESNETVVKGKFWNSSPSTQPEISVEEGMVGMMGLDLGSTITWDILGRKITARVTSVRRVDWRNSRTGFYVVFRPGTLENAPQMLIAALDGPASSKQRSHFQRELLDRFPNITVIDVVDILDGVRKFVNNITTAVSFIGGFVFFSGALILIGSIAMTKFQRVYEAAVLKTLGARRRLILQILVLEYGLLGVVAGLTGAWLGLALSWCISKYVFEIPWTYSPVLNLLGVAITALLVVCVGAFSSADILNRKPLATLRTE